MAVPRYCMHTLSSTFSTAKHGGENIMDWDVYLLLLLLRLKFHCIEEPKKIPPPARIIEDESLGLPAWQRPKTNSKGVAQEEPPYIRVWPDRSPDRPKTLTYPKKRKICRVFVKVKRDQNEIFWNETIQFSLLCYYLLYVLVLFYYCSIKNIFK